jgi:hypothetical protein
VTTNQKGRIAEAKVIAKFVELGERVLLPFGNSGRYDIGLDRGAKLVRIEVKTGRFRHGCVVFDTSSTSRVRKIVHKDYRSDADYFAVWCQEIPHTVYLVPVAIATARSMMLRVEKPHKQSNKDCIKWASDYTL